MTYKRILVIAGSDSSGGAWVKQNIFEDQN
jgi:hydroxymethylpyrimidine/phosphomethylpyrimidine kinase